MLTPHPQFLTKDFPAATRSRMEILTWEKLVGAKTAPNFQVFPSLRKSGFLVKTFLPEPGPESKVSRLGGRGWKK